MKPYFKTPIKTLEDSNEFFNALHKDGLLFHPEEGPASIIGVGGKFLFTSEEAAELDKRLDEVYMVDGDPCDYILNLINKA